LKKAKIAGMKKLLQNCYKKQNSRYDVILDQSVRALLSNHPARGGYNTEAVIFKIAVARFLLLLKKRKTENAFALIIT